MNCPHCNVHIDEHPASRCLDAWVAEAVMKLDRVRIDGTDGEAIFKRAPSTTSWGFVPIFSTDISAAWQVVEKLAKQWPDLSIGSGWNKEGDGKWSVGWGFDGHGWEWTEPCETAPLAICRAAIKAVQCKS